MSKQLPDEVAVELGLDERDDPEALRRRVAAKLHVAADELPEPRILKRSLDARRGSVRFRLLVGFGEPGQVDLAGAPLKEVDATGRVAIVGDGPAGLFCAYELARAGIGSTVLDRGKTVRPRRRDLRQLQQEGHVNSDSNYCFGEGGAGTFSDGKLYTRALKRGDVGDVLGLLAAHGAPQTILSDARPHIGSNKLPAVITALREHLEQAGVVFAFGAKVESFLLDPQHRVSGLRLADGSERDCEAAVLAAGHSAREIFRWLVGSGAALEAKGFAAGLRIEHPQPLIDRIQYGSDAGHPRLPAAAYQLAHNVDGRGVFSFCMCPGGFIIPAATAEEEVVVNGMSLSKRDSPFANSGLVVSVAPEDLDRAGYRGPLAGVDYQRRLEGLAYQAGGGRLRAPAQRASDFAARRASSSLAKSSYQPGLAATDLAELLDAAGIPIAAKLREALAVFDRRMRGYLSAEALLVGVESRTSSPLRIVRNPETLESVGLPRLYPCGEGAGYAGGIVSAALDGIRVARAVAASLSR